ncbi:molybdenum cofactor guanylyltransferase MobA [Rhizobium sp. RU36D]|uniref:molybdenum cofactor guanylyltransferase MobA n=1 Tax=Rhizobium sp. RU36D TaxID=1907415 RepID=UPI0009D85358|nr:molybdenum cofactor guanylyltransferase MobA [Rhizobium sp. RU36D]SMC80676.1 molybdenum cofactor guanylyltransferase [Rhizobium sp. RU36D]
MSAPGFPGLILAGGQSRRMGTDKTQERLAGRMLIEHVIARLDPQVTRLWVNAPLDYAHSVGREIIPDTMAAHQGPLAGVLAGLRHLAKAAPAAPGLVTIAGDTPFLPLDLVTRLTAASREGTIIALAAHKGRSHPLATYWPAALADDLEEWLSHHENRRVLSYIARHQHETVEFPSHVSAIGDIDPFFNVNTRQDLAEAETLARALGL